MIKVLTELGVIETYEKGTDWQLDEKDRLIIYRREGRDSERVILALLADGYWKKVYQA